MSNPALPLEQRVAVALDLFDLGITIMRQNLVREHPDASPEEIESMLKAWMRERPPDAPGRASTRFGG